MEDSNATGVLNATQDENGLVMDEKDLPPLVLVKKVIFRILWQYFSFDFLKNPNIYLSSSW